MVSLTQQCLVLFLELGKINHDLKDLSNLTKIMWSHAFMEVKDFCPNLILGRSQYTTFRMLLQASGGVFRPLWFYKTLCLDVTKKKKNNTGFLKTWVTSSTVLIKGAKGGFIVVDAIYF